MKQRIAGPLFVSFFLGPLKRPFRMDIIYKLNNKYIIATDAIMAVWIQYQPQLYEYFPDAPIELIRIANIDKVYGEWVDIPTYFIPRGAKKKCRSCKGTGKTIIGTDQTKEIICKNCQGNGEQITKMIPTIFLGRKINAALVHKLFLLRPEAKILSKEIKNINYFKFEDGYAAIASLRDTI